MFVMVFCMKERLIKEELTKDNADEECQQKAVGQNSGVDQNFGMDNPPEWKAAITVVIQGE